MRLYVTPAGRWAGTQADAKAIGKEDGGWEEFEVPTDKPGLLEFLNSRQVGAAPAPAPAIEPETPAPAPVPAAPPPTALSLALDDAWDELPLARQLHFASLAVERARETIRTPR